MARDRGRPASAVRHWGGFALSGLTAFAVDTAVTFLGVRALRLDPLLARVVGILTATVVAWLMHRRITFDVAYPPSLGEFLRFFVVASGANAANYVVFAAIVLLVPATPLLVAILVSSGFAALLSYLGFRFGVFRRFDRPTQTSRVVKK